jgi:hypothetical protein
MEDYKVVRVGREGPSDIPKPVTRGGKKSKPSLHKKPKFGILKHGKTARKKPRFQAVADPAKAPPSRRSKTLRILTEKGATLRRKRIADDAAKTSIHTIRHTLRKQGLPIKDSTPEKIARKIYEDARGAGMISST